MDRRIEASKEIRTFIMRTFGVTYRTVMYALNHDTTRSESDLAKRIRRLALQKGCRYVVTIPEDEAVWDSDGVMTRRFGNGARLVADRTTGKVELLRDGVVKGVWDNPTLTVLDGIIRTAESL